MMRKLILSLLCLCFAFLGEAQTLVSDIYLGLGNSNPNTFSKIGNKLIFSANDSYHGEQLYVSDGTAAGTHILINGLDSTYPGYYSSFTVIDSFGYFYGIENGQAYVYETDGSSLNTHKFISTPLNYYQSNYLKFFKLGNSICFVRSKYSSPIDNDFIYCVNRNTKVISISRDLHWQGIAFFDHDYYDFSAVTPFVFNNKIYAQTVDSIVTFNEFAQQTNECSIPNFIYLGGAVINDKIVGSRADPNTGTEPWVFDPSILSFNLLKDVNSIFNHSSYPEFFNYHYQSFPSPSKLYFVAYNDTLGNEMWVTDGSSAGTHLVNDYAVGIPNGFPANNQPQPGMMSCSGRDSYYVGDTLYHVECTGFGPTYMTNTSLSKVVNTTATNGTLYTSYDAYLFDYKGFFGVFLGRELANGIELFQGESKVYSSPQFTGFSGGLNALLVGDDIYFRWNKKNSKGNELYKFNLNGAISGDENGYLDLAKIEIYPNPTTSELLISSPSNQAFKISSITGQVLMEGKLQPGTQSIDVSAFLNGIYFLQIATETYKFCVAH